MADEKGTGLMMVWADVSADREDQGKTLAPSGVLAVPGVLNAVRGGPSYAVVYEFEHEKASESPEWLAQRDINPDNTRMRDLMTHGAGSPEICKKIFQL